MSFGEHLEELRSCLIAALIGVGLATVLTLTCGRSVLAIIFRPLWVVQRANGLQPNLQTLGPTDAFAAYLKIAILAGLIVAMPWVLYQLWRFVAAGLYPKERYFAKRLAVASSALFALGVLFLYYIALPLVLQFFITFNRTFDVTNLSPTAFQRLLLTDKTESDSAEGDASPMRVPVRREDPTDPKVGELWVNSASGRLVVQRPDGPWSIPFEPGALSPGVESQFAVPSYISFVLMLSLAFGIAFETPIVVCFLSWSGIIDTAAMRRARRHIILGIVIIAAVMTPPDVVSQLLLAFPMYFLFEIGLHAARLMERRRAQAPATAD